ncbi:MAG: flagellar filament capping protein FliD [Solirubrobacteraceae bacterium]
MSTNPITASSSTTGYLLNSLSGTTQITGLASGLNTDQIISEEMAIYQEPVTLLQNRQTALNATNTQLTSIQTALQTLAADSQAVADPSLFATSQAVSSSDPTRVSGSSATGAGVGSYEVSVTALASSAQNTYSYSSLNGGSSITIDGTSVATPAGQSISDFVNSINSNSQLDVYAATTDSNTVVLSSRSTGANQTITVDDGTGTTITPTATTAGQDAAYSVGTGATQNSHTNTVSNAIAGVTLTLSGLTSTGPVTINVGAPAASSANIQTAVNTFITQYNSVISQIQTQLSQAPSASDPSQGTLYQDPSLSNLLSSMREMMYTPGGGLPAGLATMLDVGVSTGATTGSGAVSQSALAGNLTLNADTLTSQLQANPSGVRSVLNSWSINFSALVNNEASAGGTIDERIQGDTTQVGQLSNQIATMQSALNDKQAQLVQQFAQLEAALSSNQSTSSWLTSQLSALPGA